MDGLGTAENPYFYRKSDHQMLIKNLVVRVKPEITDLRDYFDVKGTVPQTAADLEKIFGSSACHMSAA